ncbi:hypothetical protein Saro_0919 [Novosphingobium aromaticivorans DSM 12444]|uniref:DUF983 domain-containing protein n=1 Tax=Novosphingobium aromaticivorans (strain ATCC 700278 / DSM 12444 / CCUG 56034 / CIP 105152 / NBRC 16084 / F199) TaxID=279238 RepID=Q2G9V9_NOVAD|nr:DUF983 domain-containing protein [Novosphingobium aromaticivorans]ABD25364.1 hypothetical protein Saro_0919 [Novosphingobium aromaticivorans DSM 12444]SCX91177.1 Uncharacterized conserved protein, DUF983 family [Novosphingobium aromaticivorans]
MPDGESQNTKGQPGITQAALFGLCPRCGSKGLWAGPAALAERCPACGLEFERHEPRGRGMYLVVLPVTILLVLAALKLDDLVRLPTWALIALWGVVVPTVVIAALRYAKAVALMARLEKEGLL